jgi:YlmC/YmxH family sporulation protein
MRRRARPGLPAEGRTWLDAWDAIRNKAGESPVKISDFQTKDVINIVDGKKLGQISDLELDLRQGRIESIVVPAAGRFFGMFGSATELVIPWKNIVKIGLDVVLVRLDEARMMDEEDRETAYLHARSRR